MEMKRIITHTVFLLILVGSLSSCDKLRRFDLDGIDELINSIIPRPDSIFYIVGYDVDCGVEIQDSTAKARGYVLVSENLMDTLAAYNLPDSLFTFPSDIMPKNILGFNLFPQKYRFTYKVQMIYRPMTKNEQWEFLCIGNGYYTYAYSFEPTYIVITSIYRTQ